MTVSLLLLRQFDDPISKAGHYFLILRQRTWRWERSALCLVLADDLLTQFGSVRDLAIDDLIGVIALTQGRLNLASLNTIGYVIVVCYFGYAHLLNGGSRAGRGRWPVTSADPTAAMVALRKSDPIAR